MEHNGWHGHHATELHELGVHILMSIQCSQCLVLYGKRLQMVLQMLKVLLLLKRHARQGINKGLLWYNCSAISAMNS